MPRRRLTAKEFDFYKEKRKGIEDDFRREMNVVARDDVPGYLRENDFANARVKALRMSLGQSPDLNESLNFMPQKRRKKRVK